jgi:tetratricopeptide (TPR) repeat protein
VSAVLREAAQIAACQDEEQGYWRDRVLLQIAEAQIRAGDFDGAEHSINRAKKEYDAPTAAMHLAEALAGAGHCERAFQVLREMGSDYDSRPGYSGDRIRMRWLEYLIATGDLPRAALAVEELKVPSFRPEGLRKLALAYSHGGDSAAAQRCLQDAIVACTPIAAEFTRAECLWQIADAQIALSEAECASSTIDQLVALADSFTDGWGRVTALHEAATRTAQLGDREKARRRFQKAIDARASITPPTPLPATNRIRALVTIAKAQAALGYLDDARDTAERIKRNNPGNTYDSDLEEALFSVAVAQATSGDVSGARATLRSFRNSDPYETEILVDRVRIEIQHGQVAESLATAQQIPRFSYKAIAFLNIANEHAEAGDKMTAQAVAGQIHLTREDHRVFLPCDQGPFDYRRPRTWGIEYEASSTNSSRHAAIQAASEVAAAAMTFSLTLGEEYAESYAIMFKDFDCEVTQALARTHVVRGDTHEALAWAENIGSNQKIKSADDAAEVFSVQRRIHALLGVAEGILDKQAIARAQ